MHRWKHLYEGQLRLNMTEVLFAMSEGFEILLEEDPSLDNQIDAAEAAQQLCLHMIHKFDTMEEEINEDATDA